MRAAGAYLCEQPLRVAPEPPPGGRNPDSSACRGRNLADRTHVRLVWTAQEDGGVHPQPGRQRYRMSVVGHSLRTRLPPGEGGSLKRPAQYIGGGTATERGR